MFIEIRNNSMRESLSLLLAGVMVMTAMPAQAASLAALATATPIKRIWL